MTTDTPSLRVYLAACAGPAEASPVVRAWREAASRDRHEAHRLVDDPADADLILFVDLHLCPDWRLRLLLEHALVSRFRERVLVYDERDQPWCALPGLFCSMPATHFDHARQRACAYYGAVSFEGDARADAAPDLLYSFMGSRSHSIRRHILRLPTDARAIVEDTSGFVFYDRSNPEAYDRQKARYLSTLLRSQFVICPRGVGTASIRLFETLAAGRVPVIISDDWVAPAGPDWTACSVRVRESEIASIPARLAALEESYPAMATAARAAHEEWFAQSVIFHRLIDDCAVLLAAQAPARRSSRGLRYLELGWCEAKGRARGMVGGLLRRSGLR